MKTIFLILLISLTACMSKGGETILKQQLDTASQIVVYTHHDEEIPKRIVREVAQNFITEMKKGFPYVEFIESSSTQNLPDIVIYCGIDSFSQEIDEKSIRTYTIKAKAYFNKPDETRSMNYYEYVIGFWAIGEESFNLSKNELLDSGLSLMLLFDNKKPTEEDFQELVKSVIPNTQKLVEILKKVDVNSTGTSDLSGAHQTPDSMKKSNEISEIKPVLHESKPILYPLTEIKEKYKTLIQFKLFNGTIIKGGMMTSDGTSFTVMTESGQITVLKNQVKSMKVIQ